MVQGSTPLHFFTLPFDTQMIQSLRITYEQKKKVVLSKEIEDVSFDGKQIGLWLTQEETLEFEAVTPVRIQLHVLTAGGRSLVSKPVSVPVHALLDRRVIE